MILALIPLAMYSVSYELASGRPYSKFEELLLRAVDTPADPDSCTFADLREVFQVHDRLLTEGLVTLIQEGWVAMEQRDEEIHYRVTQEGKLTIASGRRPSNVKVRTARTAIVRERLSGQLARAADLAIVSGTKLRGPVTRRAWEEALKPRMIRSALNGGEVERLLPRSDERHEWIRWIDSVARVSQDLHFLPVWVDTEKQRVLGLPYQWQHLGPTIVAEVQERAEEFDNEAVQKEIRELVRASRNGKEAPDQDETTVKVKAGSASFAVATASCTDIALTAGEARRMTEQVLASCSGNVLLVVGRLDPDRAAAVRDILIELGTRQIQADVLWSGEESAEVAKDIVRLLGAARAKAPGQVAFNAAPAPIADDLVLASTPEGGVAIVGSFLEPSADDDALCPAVRLSEPDILAGLARLSAGWWEAGTGEEGLVPAQRWKYLAERWAAEGAAVTDQQTASPDRTCPFGGSQACTGEVILLTGLQRSIVQDDILTEATPRLMIGDGRTETEALIAEFIDLPAVVGRLYRAWGGADGWRFLRRAEGSLMEQFESKLAIPSAHHRLVAVRDRWLVTRAGQEQAGLAFMFGGHLAVKAWERTARRP